MSSNQKSKGQPIEFFSHYMDNWDSDTSHLTPNQEGLYCRLRQLYFRSAGERGQNGHIADDFELLCFRTGCRNDTDRQDVAWLLKDKFKKVNKYYRHKSWDRQIKNIRHAIDMKGNADTKSNAQSNGGNGGGVTSCNVGGNANIYDNTDGFVMTGAERTEKSRKLKALVNNGVQADKSMSLDQIRSLYDTTFKSGNGGGVTSCNADGNGSNAQNQANNNNLQPINNNLKNECVNSETLHAHTSFSKNLKLKSIKDWQAPSVDMVNQFLAKAGFDRQLSHDEFTTIFDKFINYNVSRELQGNFLATEQVRMDKLIDWIKREKPSYHTATTPASEISVPRTPFDKNTMIKLGFSYYPCFDNHTPAETMQIIKDHKKAGETNLETYERIKQTGVANCQKNTPASHEFVHALLSKKPKTTGATA